MTAPGWVVRWRVTKRYGLHDGPGWFAALEPVDADPLDLINERLVKFPTWREAYDFAQREAVRMWPWWP